VPRVYVNHVREGLAELASEARQRELLAGESGSADRFVRIAVAQTFDDSGLSDELDRTAAVDVFGDEAVGLLRETRSCGPRGDHTLPVNNLIDSVAMERVRALTADALDAVESRKSDRASQLTSC
jgi:hypothetical protein